MPIVNEQSEKFLYLSDLAHYEKSVLASDAAADSDQRNENLIADDECRGKAVPESTEVSRRNSLTHIMNNSTLFVPNTRRIPVPWMTGNHHWTKPQSSSTNGEKSHGKESQSRSLSPMATDVSNLIPSNRGPLSSRINRFQERFLDGSSSRESKTLHKEYPPPPKDRTSISLLRSRRKPFNLFQRGEIQTHRSFSLVEGKSTSYSSSTLPRRRSAPVPAKRASSIGSLYCTFQKRISSSSASSTNSGDPDQSVSSVNANAKLKAEILELHTQLNHMDDMKNKYYELKLSHSKLCQEKNQLENTLIENKLELANSASNVDYLQKKLQSALEENEKLRESLQEVKNVETERSVSSMQRKKPFCYARTA